MATNPVRKTAVWLLFGGIGMFCFALFVLPPLYDVFCEITGLGGKTSGPYTQEQGAQQNGAQQNGTEQRPVDLERVVKVQFVATNNGAMPWEFKPLVQEVKVHPGQAQKVAFYARNATRRDMVAQAIPSVTPISAAKFLHKTECFCFNNQPLKAGESADFPLVFFIDAELPRTVNTITLSYTLFDITKQGTEQKAEQSTGKNTEQDAPPLAAVL
ncbi:MAG: cytochrome c oxidase assembly protein [Porticoccaceae bacterium]|nr:cytochrome c oxidase assembly protein [Porticoccaceae bacterium]